jgi:hypothetical protein
MAVDQNEQNESSTGRDALKLIAIVTVCILVPWLLIKVVERFF